MKHSAEQFEFKLEKKTGKPVYSYSQVETAKCGRRFYYNRIDRANREQTYNLVAGTILDTAFNAYYENNQHLHESHDDRMRYARAAVELLLQENPDWLRLEWSQKAGDVRSSPDNYVAWLFDHGALALVCRHDRGPVEVQKCVRIDLPLYSIVGYIDCLELSTNTVVDIKAVTGWSSITNLSYSLRSQVSLYRMMLADSEHLQTSGRYELLLCRKTPKLSIVEDPNIDFIQAKILQDFDDHHRRVSTNCFEKNPAHCFDFNRVCGAFQKCWPEIKPAVEQN